MMVDQHARAQAYTNVLVHVIRLPRSGEGDDILDVFSPEDVACVTADLMLAMTAHPTSGVDTALAACLESWRAKGSLLMSDDLWIGNDVEVLAVVVNLAQDFGTEMVTDLTLSPLAQHRASCRTRPR